MTEIDVARIRADMKRNQYAEPEDTEALIVALDEARLEARNMKRERDAAHREVADRMAERDEARAIVEAARAELEAFAATPIPDGLEGLAALAAVNVTAPFIARMRAALGGAQ